MVVKPFDLSPVLHPQMYLPSYEMIKVWQEGSLEMPFDQFAERQTHLGMQDLRSAGMGIRIVWAKLAQQFEDFCPALLPGKQAHWAASKALNGESSTRL